MANNFDPDQIHSMASGLGLHCFQSLSVPISKVISVFFYFAFLLSLHVSVKGTGVEISKTTKVPDYVVISNGG